MAKLIAAVICVALFGLVASPMDAVAQQKTAKACREEWRANRTANQADLRRPMSQRECHGQVLPPCSDPTGHQGTEDSKGMPR